MRKKQLLILMTLLISTIGYSQSVGDTFIDSFITYEIISLTPNEVEAIGYNVVGGSVVNIPATTTHNTQNYNITSIGNDAFRNKQLVTVSITPNTVTSIGNDAFRNNQLSTIIIPNGVTDIGNNAFGQNLLISVDIADSVTSIGSYAFFDNNISDFSDVTYSLGVSYIPEGCFYENQLTSLIIPSSITSIEEDAFQLNQMVSLTLPNSVQIIRENSFANNQLGSLTLPDSVTNIGSLAFSNNPLTCITSEATTPPNIITGTDDSFGNRSNIDLSIPSGSLSDYIVATWTGFNSVAEGLAGTFVVDNITYQINPTPNNEVTVTDYNTTGGTVVNIPETVISACTTFTVTDIDNFAMDNMGITSITLPNSIVNIGNSAFENNQIASLSITPNTVTNIGAEAFRGNLITNLVIPNGVTDIGAATFANNLLTSIDIADSVTFIDEYAFQINNISSFDDVVLPIGFTNIPEGLFYDNQFVNLVIPNTITSVGSRAFQFNSGLTTVRIPNSVTFIDDRAFADSQLSDVYSEATIPPSIITGGSLDTFADDRSTIHLHIPAGTMGAYVTDAGALWTGFNPVTEDALSLTDFELANSIKIVTNSNSIEIVSSSLISLESYSLYTISGAKVSSGLTTKIPTTSFAKGIYILRLDFDRGSVSKKIIIK